MNRHRRSFSARMGAALLTLTGGFALILSGCSNAASSSGTSLPWTWVAGASSINQPGSYTSTGSTGTPGGRNAAAIWTDSSGNLWLFGGSGYGASSSGFLSDLWKYDGTDWTWIAGSSSLGQDGIYTDGTLCPGGRYEASAWTDSDGNLWLFGGYGHGSSSSSSTGYLNDLWKCDSSGTWTWVAGSNLTNQTGTYSSGTLCPGGREEAAGCYDSTNNCFWLFGGNGYGSSSSSSYGRLGDLWKCDSSGTWTCVMDIETTNEQTGSYPDSVGETGTPGARFAAVAWYDSDNNYIWLFGGQGLASSSSTYGYLNDLWKYDIDAGTWTWVAGSNSLNAAGTYTGDTPCPGARYEASAWTDSDGNLWLFGGRGYTADSSGYLNDLWKYDTSEGTWTWVAGSSSVGQTGTYSDAVGGTGTPGARCSASAVSDSSGNLWLFGGTGYSASAYGRLNDLWKYSD